jgi:hypothetical protein
MLPLVSKTMPIESGASSLPNETISARFVFEKLEGVLIESGDEAVQRIGDGDGNQHDVRIDADIGLGHGARLGFPGLGAGVI